MLKLYNIPGRLVAELWYLWPKKGEIWASGRRREHPFVHFLYSTVIYLVAGLILTGSLSNWRSNDRSQDEATTDVTTGSLPEAEIYTPLSDDSAPTPLDDIQSDADIVQASPVDPLPMAAQPSPSASSEIKSAMRDAFESGNTVRWESDDSKGYAVPSAIEAQTRCRTVYYSVDDRPGWTSSPETICP